MGSTSNSNLLIDINDQNRINHHSKVRLTVFCAKNLVKQEFFSLPDPFCKIEVDGTRQVFATGICKDTLNPKWNIFFDLNLNDSNSITISIFNNKKEVKKRGSGFLGCVRIRPNVIQTLKDTGFQRMDLQKNKNNNELVKGQIVISLLLLNNNVHLNNNYETIEPNLLDSDLSNNNDLTIQDSSLNYINDLPEGWEVRETFSGKKYYLNHNTKHTQWKKPTFNNSKTNNVNSKVLNNRLNENNDSDNDLNNRNPQRRSTRHRHYLARNMLHQAVANATNDNFQSPPNHSRNNLTTENSISNGVNLSLTNLNNRLNNTNINHQRSGSNLSANNVNQASISSTNKTEFSINNCVFLKKSDINLPDGYEMRIAPKGQVYFYQTHTGLSTWYDPRVPRELIDQRINLDELIGPLEREWEIRTTVSGRKYYVNHKNKTTQFTDPRLVSGYGLLENFLRNQNLEQNNNSCNNEANNNRCDKLPTIINTNVNTATTNTINTITGNNTIVTPPSVSREIDLNLQKDSVQRKNLVQKMSNLRKELSFLQTQSGHCKLEITRKDIFEESYRVIMKLRPKDLRKRLMVKFKGEEGLDYGGIAREWLYLLSHEMLNPYYGLFQYTREDIYTLQINPDSAINPEHLSYFHFVGRIIGVAVFHGHYIDGGFTLPFYKMLLNKSINLDDIQVVDPELHRSLCWMLNNDIVGVIDTTFSVEHDSFGELKIDELKPNGKEIQVNESNKKEYVRLYVNYRFKMGIEQQFQYLQKGFFEIIPQHFLNPFDEKELDLVISGLAKIDINDWKLNTRLKHCTSEHNIIKWFWQAVNNYSEEKRARLLQFVTGSSRVPLQGFKALQGSTGTAGPRLFTIHLIEASTDNLPKAHTCFNRIDIPAYENYEKLYEKLTQAIEETCGFTIE